jgi:hypothetical protein
MSENILLQNKHVLVVPENITPNPELEYIIHNFCGVVLTCMKTIQDDSVIIYLTGNIENIQERKNTYIIKEFSSNYEGFHIPLIDSGKVPLNIHNVGVYFTKFFDDPNYFKLISTQHQFQNLTESNKAGQAFRKGIYMTDVTPTDDGLKYHLLRCSSNLTGPTDNFRDIDHHIVNQVNNISKQFFSEDTELNHVLAQIYYNNDKKASIKAHSDKTKDMPRNGLIAFCTFYDQDLDQQYLYKGTTSVFTRLHFRRKNSDPNLVNEFDVVLYPNSVFIIPLSCNREFTHEIKPSVLPKDKIPVRMGYVIRCSKTEVVFKDGQTYIGDVKLEPMTDNDATELRKLYLKENATDEMVEYGDVYFSMNQGDYLKPIE